MRFGSDTLTHWVKQAEVASGAGTATVMRVLAEKINENAAPGDVVSGKQLRDRVQYNEGKVKCGNSANNSTFHQPDETASIRPAAMQRQSQEGGGDNVKIKSEADH